MWMAKGNAWIAALLVTGTLCVSAAVVKHMRTPPPKLPDVTPPPSATGDGNPADNKAWDDLTLLIDTQACDEQTLKILANQTDWYKSLYDDHVRSDVDIEQDRAAIAEYKKVRGYVVALLQRRMWQGVSIIKRMQDSSRGKTLNTFAQLEQGLAAEEIRRQQAQKDMLATLNQLLSLAAIREERKMTAAESASWNSLYSTLMQQQGIYKDVYFNADFQVTVDYEQLDHLVGRVAGYPNSRSSKRTVTCNEPTIHADVEKKAQEVLAR
jgi:predicted metal-dependent hydrolase